MLTALRVRYLCICALSMFAPIEIGAKTFSDLPKASMYLTLGMTEGFNVDATEKQQQSSVSGDYTTRTGLSIGAGFGVRIYRPLSLGIGVDYGAVKTQVYNTFGSRVDITQTISQGSLAVKILVPLLAKKLAVRGGLGVGFGYLGEILFEGWTRLSTYTYSIEILLGHFLVQFQMAHIISGSNDIWEVATDDILMIRAGLGSGF